MVYDERLGRVVLLGDGEPDTVPPGTIDAWSWDGRRWQRLTATGPAWRYLSAAVYDSSRTRTLLFGGIVPPGTSTAETWEFDGRDWRQAAPSAVPPRDHHSMTFDVARGRTVLFGGGRTFPADTWEFDGAAWTRAAADGPSGRGRTALAYDAGNRRAVLFGGLLITGPPRVDTFFGDTWTWDGTRWQKAADTGPPARFAHALAYDRKARVVLLYGGATRLSPKAVTADHPVDMWKWDGRAWTEIVLTGATPGPRYSPSMAYDAARDRTVLFGGIRDGRALGDTWEWDGRQWKEIR